MHQRLLPLLAALLLASAAAARPLPQAPRLTLEPGDRVVLMGNALAERQLHDGWLETRLQLLHPELGLSFRNLGFGADALTVRQRTDGFGSPEEWLARSRADVVFSFFGFNESFAGRQGLATFRSDLEAFVDGILAQTGPTGRPLRLVLFSSLPFENLNDPSLPDGAQINARLALYDAVQAEVAAAKGIAFVDLAAPLKSRYAASAEPLTLNGIHMNAAGHAALADVVVAAMAGRPVQLDSARAESVRAAVCEKNLLWFNRYHATDGYNVYGGRSSLAYTDGVTNFEVLQRELSVLDALCDQLDLAIVALARGEPRPPAAVIGEGTIPPLIEVVTNFPGEGPDGKHLYLGGEQAIAQMTPAPGMRVELFADEARFPELANPVQMAFDTRGRLWVAVWPTYPHWEPGQPMNDKLLVFEDTDGDGRADSVQAFADDLHNPTGFEFWNGGVFVANPPDILFLRDNDGDGVADERRRVLHGLSSGDTHHSANSFVLGPDGALYFQEGIFHQSQIETIYGPLRNRDASAWRFEPRTWRTERYIPYGFLNPHGHVFDRWGQDFVTDGTTNQNYFALPASGHIEPPRKRASYFTFFAQRSRPAAATEILSSRHFPEANQGNYLIANVIGFRGIFQYAFEDDGSGFGAREVDSLVFSADPNFRPVDIETGPDGAVWFIDWHNAIIGHMQHHLRDPSRDHEHGRVYRVVAEDRPLLTTTDLTRLTVPELVATLASPEDRVRYRARIELSARPRQAVIDAALAWAAGLSGEGEAAEHDRLEALWLLQQHDALDAALLARVLASPDPRARAAATRVVRGMRHRIQDPLALLGRAVRDPHPRVRLGAVVGLSFLPSAEAVRLTLSALDEGNDRFLAYAIDETVRALDAHWRAALAAGDGFMADDPDGLAYLLARSSDAELAALPPSSFGTAEAVLWQERLWRPGLEPADVLAGLQSLARLQGGTPAAQLLALLERADGDAGDHADHRLMGLFAAVPELGADDRAQLLTALRRLAIEGLRMSTRRLATRARMQAEGSVEPAWREASRSPGALSDLLDAALLVDDASLAGELYARILQLLGDMPRELAAQVDAPTRGRYVRIELPGQSRTLTLAEVEVFSGGENVAPRGRAEQSSLAWEAGPGRAIDGNRSPNFGAGGQTHTIENRPNPWWQVDLGAEQPIDAVVLWNRNEGEGEFSDRLDGALLRVLDGQRRTVYRQRLERAPLSDVRLEIGTPQLHLRRSALSALAALAGPAGRGDETALALARAFDDAQLRDTAVAALRALPAGAWPAAARQQVAASLIALFEGGSQADFKGLEARELLALADELAAQLEPDAAGRLLRARRPLGPQVIVIRTVPDSLMYDRVEFSVVAGQAVELVFDNVDIMPHNLVVTAPGALAKVGLAAERMASSPDAAAREYRPDLPEVLQASRLLQPGERQVLEFTAPERSADYPYVCTFPGHWLRMNGIMHVVADWDQLAEPELAVPIAASAGRAFVREWTAGELIGQLPRAVQRSPAAGRAVLEAASCLRCHAVDGEGGTTGPDLREVTARYTPEELLTHLVEPSLKIDPVYVNEMFFMLDGTIHAGRVVREQGGSAFVQEDPYAEREPVEVPLADVDERVVSNISTMPSGLLSTFQRDEILDLIAYLTSLAPQTDAERKSQ